MSTKPLTIADTVALATIIRCAQTTSRVRWLNDRGDLLDGTARCIAHDGGGFPGPDEDIRDMYLHVSGPGECWLPVSDLIGLVQRGEFAAVGS